MRTKRPKQSAQSWTLLDGEELNQQYPFTVHLPPGSARYYAPVGSVVNLFFQATDEQMAGEFTGLRHWVRVCRRQEVDGKIVFVGHLTGHPPLAWTPQPDDEIVFEPRNIIQIEERPANEGERLN